MRCLLHRLVTVAAALRCLRLSASESEDDDEFKGRVPRPECVRGPEWLAARQPNSLNATFMPIFAGEKFAELKPRILTTDPWILFFEEFLSEAEVAEYLELVKTQEFKRSTVQGAGKSRTSETAQCSKVCQAADIYHVVRKRAGAVVGVPPPHFETTQTTRYRENTFFRPHYDNSDALAALPPGPRIFTVFIYLTTPDEGGATRFPKLGLEVPARRGGAIVFVNTLDAEPFQNDPRSLHEGSDVKQGEKLALNLWARMYEFEAFLERGCNSKEEIYNGVNNESISQTLTIHNQLYVDVEVYWVMTNNGELPASTVKANGVGLIHSFVGHRFHVRKIDGELLLKFVVPKMENEQKYIVTVKDRQRQPDSTVPVHITNLRDDRVLIYWMDESRSGDEKLISEIEPNATRTLMSYVGHMFHIRDAGTRNVLREFQVPDSLSFELILRPSDFIADARDEL